MDLCFIVWFCMRFGVLLWDRSNRMHIFRVQWVYHADHNLFGSFDLVTFAGRCFLTGALPG